MSLTKQTAHVGEPHRAFQPAEPVGQPLQWRIRKDEATEALVDDLETVHQRMLNPPQGSREGARAGGDPRLVVELDDHQNGR